MYFLFLKRLVRYQQPVIWNQSPILEEIIESNPFIHPFSDGSGRMADCESESYNINDIVVYDSGREMIVHRIKEQNGDTLTTKGDANNISDEPINAEAVKGKVVFSIPYAGAIVKALRSPVGIIVIILTAILLTEGSFRRKKESDENRIEEIKEEIRRLKAEQDNKSE